jgi:hypothetical protein
MGALSAAEHIAAACPVAPNTISVAPHSEWGYLPGSFEWRLGVQLAFLAPDSVRQFAASLGVAVQERPYADGLQTYADGVLNGVPFRAWSLTDIESSAVAA